MANHEKDGAERVDPSADGPRLGVRRRVWIPAVGLLIGLVLAVVAIAAVRFADAPRDLRAERHVADVSSERVIAFGSVVGYAADHDTHAWLGIPFAKPPSGDLRWRAPVAPSAWADTHDALVPLSACPQLGRSIGGVPAEEADGFAGSEDCLGLNVWAPRFESDDVPRGRDRLPVMVWIHGGGNTTGEGGASMYDGARLAGTENVVVVTFNYRLGPLGWFGHSALRKEAASRAEASGNFGTLDQIRALEWVRDNIAEFGGDPGNVTIFGESAGGTNVLALLVSKPAAGLFHRAIAQSGSTDSASRAEAENASDDETPGHFSSSEEVVLRLLETSGVVPDRDSARRYAAERSHAELLEFLRGRSAREIIDAVRKPGRENEIDVPKLIRDGVVLPTEDWLDVFRTGRFNAVPTLLGSNRDEMKLFHAQRDEYVRKSFKMLYRIRDPAAFARRARYASDLWKVRAVDRPAAAIAESGRTKVYGYRFDWDEEPRLLGTDFSELLGASHGFEIPFLFGNFDLGHPFFSALIFNDDNRAARERLGERMRGYWAEFARTGRPGRGGHDAAPEWQGWVDPEDNVAARIMIFDTDADGGLRMASTRLTRDRVLAALESEPDLEQSEKCALYQDLFLERPDWQPEEYRRFGHGGCADDPFAETLQ